MKNPKTRGQKRKLNRLLNDINKIHVPCGWWLSEPKTSSTVKTEFCKKWLDKTREIINSKPQNDKFCRIPADITSPYFWNSQIIIFYDENYYNNFFNRTGPY